MRSCVLKESSASAQTASPLGQGTDQRGSRPAIEEALKLISADNAQAWFKHCFDGLQ